MGHTNTTPNYNLPQFLGSDKPAWLTDVNNAMSAIDTAIAAAKAAADNAGGAAAALATTVGGHTTQLETLSNTVANQGASIVSQGNAINTISELIGNGTPTTTDHTLIGAINELNAKEGDLADLQTTNKSSLVAAINEAAQGGGSASYTLAGSVTNTEASAGGSATSTTLTVPSGATELLLRVVDTNGYVWSSEIGFPADEKLLIVVLRNSTTAISDRCTATFTPDTGVLDIAWELGTAFNGVKAELYYK